MCVCTCACAEQNNGTRIQRFGFLGFGSSKQTKKKEGKIHCPLLEEKQKKKTECCCSPLLPTGVVPRNIYSWVDWENAGSTVGGLFLYSRRTEQVVHGRANEFNASHSTVGSKSIFVQCIFVRLFAALVSSTEKPMNVWGLHVRRILEIFQHFS